MHELALLLASEAPESLRSHGYELGGAYVFELSDRERITHRRYELVARFVPTRACAGWPRRLDRRRAQSHRAHRRRAGATPSAP